MLSNVTFTNGDRRDAVRTIHTSTSMEKENSDEMSMDDLLKSLLGGAEGAPQGAQDESLGAIGLPDLLQGILGGMGALPQAQQPQGQPSQGAGDIGDILGGILGGGAGSAQGSSAGGLGDILGGILGGGAGSTQGSSAGGLGDILGGILGGGAGSTQGSSAGSAGGLGDILGGILGGGTGSTQGSSGGGLGDILGGILGGGTSSTQGSAGAGGGLSSILAPIVQSLAQKMGLPPAIAQIVVGFALGKLLPSLMGGASSQAQKSLPSQRRAQTPSQSGGFDLDDLMDRLGSGNAQSVNASYLQSSGMAAQLAQQTGLDEDVAAQSLQQVFLTFGNQMTATRSAQSPADAPVRRPGPRAGARKRPAARKRQTWEA